MSVLVADCPRCRAKDMSFDLEAARWVGREYGWKNYFEAFCVCRRCKRSTIFKLSQNDTGNEKAIANLPGYGDAVNRLMTVDGYVSVGDFGATPAPEHLPKEIGAVFSEGARCLAIGCNNAAGTMFRLCIDLASRSLLPENNVNGLNATIRRSLGLRLPWLFDNQLLPEELRDLSHCVKEDGNDAAHAGTLSKEDAADLLDFTTALLERLYTEPERLKLAKQRREQRRKDAKQ